MRGTETWSYRPYKPFFYDVGDIYVCRIAPGKSRIHLEWLNDEAATCEVFCRVRGSGEFRSAGVTDGCEWDIEGLCDQTDYEFYVVSGTRKSRVRLARTGEAIGTVVNYLHPDDEAYSFSGRYLCSPSLVRHPDGFLLASMDLFAGYHPQNLTLIFRSDDEGETFFSRSTFVMDDHDFRINQSSMTVLQIKKTQLSTGNTSVLFCREGFSE